MDTSISVQVFDWRGELWLAIDRVGRVAGRRYAPRARLATFHALPLRDVSEDEACLWMYDVVTSWVNQGCPRVHLTSAERSRLPLEGDTGGRRAYEPSGPSDATLKEAADPPRDQRRAERVSGGLSPEGHTPPMF
jgi:hypothetical protein